MLVSNQRPHVPQTCVLPTELMTPCYNFVYHWLDSNQQRREILSRTDIPSSLQWQISVPPARIELAELLSLNQATLPICPWGCCIVPDEGIEPSKTLLTSNMILSHACLPFPPTGCCLFCPQGGIRTHNGIIPRRRS